MDIQVKFFGQWVTPNGHAMQTIMAGKAELGQCVPTIRDLALAGF